MTAKHPEPRYSNLILIYLPSRYLCIFLLINLASNITSHWNQRKPVIASNCATNSFMRHKTMGGMVKYGALNVYLIVVLGDGEKA